LPSLAPSLDNLARVASTEVPVVLLGETGTGKEVVARATHELSGRRGAFTAVNCGSLSPALVEGLLFGHVKGSFSGATRDELGFVRAAHGGTLFLDEIGDFPVTAQPALLRVLPEREVVPVGASRPVHVDFRVIAATHRDLDNLVAQNGFRRDLLMRVDGFRHALPSLRARREDLGLLFADLLPRRAGARAAEVTFTTDALRAILEWEWPGNVRELEQVLAKSLALAHDEPIGVEHLGLPTPPPAGQDEGNRLSPSDAHLREEVVAALVHYRGNVTEVARALGKARMQVQRWIRRFQLDPEEYRRAK
jgi:DNA-binding NtrC family response regulator